MLKQPIILGVVNITEDSFSDGEKYLNPSDAIAHAKQLHADGADIIDLGPSASHPGAIQLTAQEEIARLQPIVDALSSEKIAISIDSFLSETQHYGIEHRVSMLNDVQGFSSPHFYSRLADSDCKLVVMHSVQEQGIADLVATDPQTIMNKIKNFFTDRISTLLDAGISANRIILDPGMGFFLGMNPEPSIEVLRHFSELKQCFNFPIFMCVSRKSFLRNITHRTVEEVGAATLAAEIYLILQGIDYIRTHDVKALHDAIEVLRYLV